MAATVGVAATRLDPEAISPELLLAVLFLTLILAMSLVRGPGGPFSALTLLLTVYTIGFCGRGLELLAGQQLHLRRAFDLSSPDFIPLFNDAVMLAEVGAIALYTGFALTPSFRRLDTALSRFSGPLFEDALAFWVVVLAGTGLSLLGILLFLLTVSTPNQLLAGEVSVDTTIGQFYIFVLINAGVIAQQIAVTRWLASEHSGWAMRGIAVCLTLALIAFALFAGLKSILLIPVFSIVVTFHLLRHKLRFLHLVAGLIAFSATFPFFYDARAVGLAAMTPDEIANAYSDPLGIFRPFIGRLYSLDAAMLSYEWVDRRGADLLYGESLADLPVFWIPRSLWPDKPVSFALTFGRTVANEGIYGENSFVAPSLIGELFLDWHVPGVVLGCFGIGSLIKAASSGLIGGSRTTLLGVSLYPGFLVHTAQLCEGPIASHIEFFLIDVATVASFAIVAALIVRARHSVPHS